MADPAGPSNEDGIVVDYGTVIDMFAGSDGAEEPTTNAPVPVEEPVVPDPVFRPGSEVDYAAPDGTSGTGTDSTADYPGEVPGPTSGGTNPTSGSTSTSPSAPEDESSSPTPAPGPLGSTATGPTADDDNVAFQPDPADPGATEDEKNNSATAPGADGSPDSRDIVLEDEIGDEVGPERNSWMWVIIVLAVISLVFLCCCVFGRRFCMGRGSSE